MPEKHPSWSTVLVFNIIPWKTISCMTMLIIEVNRQFVCVTHEENFTSTVLTYDEVLCGQIFIFDTLAFYQEWRPISFFSRNAPKRIRLPLMYECVVGFGLALSLNLGLWCFQTFPIALSSYQENILSIMHNAHRQLRAINRLCRRAW